MSPFIELIMFAAKAIILIIIILFGLVSLIMILAKSKQKSKNKLTIKNLNQKYLENAEMVLAETETKKALKTYFKHKKAQEKAHEKSSKKNQECLCMRIPRRY